MRTLKAKKKLSKMRSVITKQKIQQLILLMLLRLSLNQDGLKWSSLAMIYWVLREDFLSKLYTMIPHIPLVEDQKFFIVRVKFKYVSKSGDLGNTVILNHNVVYMYLILDSPLNSGSDSGIREQQHRMGKEKKVWQSNFVT